MRYMHKSKQLCKILGGNWAQLLVIERLSLMLRKVDTSVLGVMNFMWFQRHCFNALDVMNVW